MSANGINRRLEALERLISDQANQAGGVAEKYLATLTREDIEFLYQTWLTCRRLWADLTNTEQEQLTSLLAPLDPDGSQLAEYRAYSRPAVPTGITYRAALDGYLALLRVGRPVRV